MSIEFSANISALRRDRGISQKQAAEALGISQALLSHYEKGIRECNLDFVKKVADYYDVTADYLLGLTDSRQKTGDIFAPDALTDDNQLRVKTVMRNLLYLSQKAEAEDEALQMYFTDFFTLCVKKYTASLNVPDSPMGQLCDVSLNRLCRQPPEAAGKDEYLVPLFAQTVDRHALLLLNNDLTNALESN